MSKNWLLSIRTKLRNGTYKISASPMLCEYEISNNEAMEVAVSQFGAERVISVIAK